MWPNAGIPGQLAQDLPTWTHFEQAAELVTEDDVAEPVPCGPDVGHVLDSVRQYLDAGYDHLYFHQIGPDQDGFFRFWESEPAAGARRPPLDRRQGRQMAVSDGTGDDNAPGRKAAPRRSQWSSTSSAGQRPLAT